MSKIKTVAIWVAVIWGANSLGSHGYRVGDAVSWAARTSGGLLTSTANAVNGAGKGNK
jgi:hypothetical protein